MTEPTLERRLTLRGAVTLNLLDMIGVGPFITLPLLIGAMGGAQAMLGWVLGAVLALMDGLVWAELGAAMPEAGGTYHFLRTIFPGRWGEWLGFLFLFQLLLSAPLSIASGAIGLAQYAGVLLPPLAVHHGYVLTAMAAVALATLLLARRVDHVAKAGALLLGVVLLLIAWTILTGVMAGHWRGVLSVPPGAWHLDQRFFLGLGSAMLIATYDYWGYYNVVFLAGEARDPGRTLPRAILFSIGIVAVLYLLLNASVLSILPASVLSAATDGEARRAMLATFMRTAYTPYLGTAVSSRLAGLAAVLVCVTAFSSICALLLGYSRVPFAAAREGGFFAAFGRLAPGGGYPSVSLFVLAALAAAACTLSLPQVIASLVVVRVLLQFLLQHVGLMVLRRRQPAMPRPFRVWLYPWPPLLAIGGFLYILFVRTKAAGGLLLALSVVVVGSVLWFAWQRASAAHPGA